ncbi:hypothetical protein V2A60_002706 [Cordyceps javanica]
MTPAAGSRPAGSPDDAAAVALQGASLAFQKRPPQTTSSTSQSAASLRSSSKHQTTPTPDSTSRSRSRSPPLHNQQHGLEHYRENGALLAATSSVERAKSPGAAAALTPATRSSPLGPHRGQHRLHQHTASSDAQSPEIESDTVLPAGLVASRLKQLGISPTTTAAHSVTTITTATTKTAKAATRASSASPPSHLTLGLSPQSPAGVAAKLDAKSPSLIAATLAASRSSSPTPTTLRKPRRVHSANTLQIVDAVDSQPIPTTDSLISMFEADKARGSKHATSPRRIATSSPEQPVVRQSARPSPIPIKQTTVSPTPPTNRTSDSKQRASKGRQYDRPPTPPQATHKKSAAAAPRRPPTPPAVMDATPVSTPSTPTSASKAIARVAANKPRVTPPKFGDALKVDGPLTTATPSKIVTRSKSTAALKKPNVGGEAPSHKRVRKPSPLRLSNGQEGGHMPTSASPNPTTPRHKSPTPRVISRSTPEVLSPKPTRIARTASLRASTPPPAIVLRPTADVQSPSPDPKKRTPGEKRPPTPPKPRNSQRLAPARLASGRPRGNSATPLPKATPVNSMWGLPIVSSTTSNTPKAGKPQPPPPNRRESIVSAPPSPTHEPPRRRLTRSPSNPMRLNSMANAIMASSLASSRLTPHNTGSSLPPPPLPVRQRSPHLLQTLRQPQSEPENDHDRQRKNHRHRLHSSKHMHHEGSRKRWRDQVTDKERKRYEALWASNRGLLLTHESPSASVGSGLGTELSECVVNVVVRDIWKRSRLPAEELAEVWELVDREHRGYLTRQEFVVGMFLIDQRLRGRKLPPKVSDSIWGSVNGVTVSKPRVKKH